MRIRRKKPSSDEDSSQRPSSESNFNKKLLVIPAVIVIAIVVSITASGVLNNEYGAGLTFPIGGVPEEEVPEQEITEKETIPVTPPKTEKSAEELEAEIKEANKLAQEKMEEQKTAKEEAEKQIEQKDDSPFNEVTGTGDQVEVGKNLSVVGYFKVTSNDDWYGDFVDGRKLPNSINKHGDLEVQFRCYEDEFLGTSTYFGTFRNVKDNNLKVEVIIDEQVVQEKSTTTNQALILEGSCI